VFGYRMPNQPRLPMKDGPSSPPCWGRFFWTVAGPGPLSMPPPRFIPVDWLVFGTCRGGFLLRASKSEAIQQIVDAYVRLNNRRALEDLRMHRQRMAVDLKSRTGFDLSLPIRQIDEEIAVIEAGLERLNSTPSA
jgi:hypothetical protein